MKRFFILLCIFLILAFNYKNYIVFANTLPPSVASDGAVLMDADTGTILYSKNMNTAYPPASTTKIMTALLTIENINLNDIITVSKKTPYVDGSKIGIFEGEEIKAKDLLYGLLLLSGNDCAEALAEHISGSTDTFAKLMNKRAKELGCENTNFVNPHGLYDNNHKTSAKDLAIILNEAMKHPEFREIASTFIYKIPPTNKHPEGIYLANENKLIQKNSKYYYKEAEAGKTGYTTQSGFSYVASAIKDNHRLILALVHSNTKSYYEDSVKLFNYGFNNFEVVSLFKKGDIVTTLSQNNLVIPLAAYEDYYYIKEKGSNIKPEFKLLEPNIKSKTFKKGDIIAEASINLNGNILPNLKLVSTVDYKYTSNLKQSLISNKSKFNIALYGISILLIISILTFIIKKKRKLDVI
jgi:D-alanyl-D-alanine carboxypeptidase